jgi:hypothetical protein
LRFSGSPEGNNLRPHSFNYEFLYTIHILNIQQNIN